MGKQSKKRKNSSIIALSITGGLFLGIGMGALMNSLLPVMVLGLLAGAGLGYYIDKKNGIPYTRKN